MNLNILHPKAAVESAFEKPSLGMALGLVLVSAIVAAAGGVLFGFSLSAMGAGYSIIISFVRFFALAVVVYILSLLLGRSAAKGKFLGLLSALSLLQIIAIIASILSLIAIPIVLSPEAMELAHEVQGLSAGEAGFFIAGFAEAAPEAINMPALYALTAITLLLALWNFYILYRTVRRAAESGLIGAVLVAIVTFVVMGALPI